MTNWNSAQYMKFLKERTLPSVDLANRITAESPKKIIDIGCGPGNSTKVLAERFPNAEITGADNSAEMINRAKENCPDLNFILFDAASDFSALEKDYDVVFSNACIQWVPNHPLLLKNMMSVLKPGGTLAVQIPMNYEEPIHQIISKLVSGEKWKNKFCSPRIFYTLSESDYFGLLSDISSDFSIWKTVYFHRMPSHESIIEWYKGTGLRPYLSVLDEADAEEFEKDVYREVVKSYPIQENGEIIFRFPRFFFTAVK